MLGVVFSTFVICWAPFFIMNLILGGSYFYTWVFFSHQHFVPAVCGTSCSQALTRLEEIRSNITCGKTVRTIYGKIQIQNRTQVSHHLDDPQPHQRGAWGWQDGALVGLPLLHHQPPHIHRVQRQVQVIIEFGPWRHLIVSPHRRAPKLRPPEQTLLSTT